MGSLNIGCQLLLWDAYKCHIKDNVRSYIDQQTNTNDMIPGGLTSHLQLANLSRNKCFKAAHKAKYDNWMVTREKSYTAVGNMHPPSKALCLGCVRACWEILPTEIIQKSFLVCGISIDVDGTDDRYLKPVRVAAEARTTNTARPLSDDGGDKDPFM